MEKSKLLQANKELGKLQNNVEMLKIVVNGVDLKHIAPHTDKIAALNKGFRELIDIADQFEIAAPEESVVKVKKKSKKR